MVKPRKSNVFVLKYKTDAFRDIRQSHAIREDVNARAARIAAEAASYGGGNVEGYMVTDLVLEEPRAAASVMATKAAHHHNREHNSLVRALDAGKG